MNTAVVTTKGQVVIPSRIRRKLNIKKGTKLYVEERDNEIILRPLTQAYFEQIAGILQTKGKLTKLLINERVQNSMKRE